MLRITEEKKHEFWNHFLAKAFEERSLPVGITGPRVRAVKPVLWQDNDFWFDIILRHGCLGLTPEQLLERDPQTYAHCQGNFWGMVYQTVLK